MHESVCKVYVKETLFFLSTSSLPSFYIRVRVTYLKPKVAEPTVVELWLEEVKPLKYLIAE